MTSKNNRAHLVSNIKLCASFHHHMWIQTGVTVRKRLCWALTSVTLTFDLWPWPFAWTSFLSLVISPENFMMIRCWEHSQKGVTDRRTDRRTDGLNHSYSCLVAAKNCGVEHLRKIQYYEMNINVSVMDRNVLENAANFIPSGVLDPDVLPHPIISVGYYRPEYEIFHHWGKL